VAIERQEDSAQQEDGVAEAFGDAVAEPVAAGKGSGRRFWFAVIAAVFIIDVLAWVFVPPFPPDQKGAPCVYPACFIQGNFEFPVPKVVIDLAPNQPSDGLVTFHPSITSTIITTWLVMIIVLPLAILAARRRALYPGRVQNAFEYLYESLRNWAMSLGGPPARAYVPLFSALFIFILCASWSGLIPIIARGEIVRAPTSDVNVTLGLAMVSFLTFHIEGVRKLGLRGYMGKFLRFGAFKEGVVAGAIAFFVGLIELFLELFKPITLALRLFGNIFGGELALGVMTAVTVAMVPVALLGLEFFLNFAQALIFSTLTLMFTVLAIESHDEEAHAAPAFAEMPLGDSGPSLGAVDPHQVAMAAD
jgi:F-type H+-transporting ATPase subunit a